MYKQNDRVKVIKTGEVGYVDRVLDNGERFMVRIPSSEGWPYPHHIYVVKENIQRAGGSKNDLPEALI